MKVVARQTAVGGQVVPIHAGARVPAASSGAIDTRVAQLESQLAQMVKVHNAVVESFNKVQKEHAALMADYVKVKHGASSLAKHFQGLAAACAQAGITYQPIVVQAPQQRTVPQPRAAAQGARVPPSQQTVNAQPAAPQAPAQTTQVWEQRENLFYEGGEGPEG